MYFKLDQLKEAKIAFDIALYKDNLNPEVLSYLGSLEAST
jgi:hypothetical protein